MKTPINNFELIYPLLEGLKEGEFYYLQILQRKKDNPEIGSNSRVIKNYYIKSVDYLKERKDEIIKLCEVFNARASLRLNKRSFEKVAFKTMVNTANVMMNKEYEFVKKVYDRACGETHNDPVKKWIIDIDYDEYWPENSLDTIRKIEELKQYVNILQPLGDKIIAVIPSKTGIHIITTPFRLDIFNMDYMIDVHKDNPTNLYIP